MQRLLLIGFAMTKPTTLSEIEPLIQLGALNAAVVISAGALCARLIHGITALQRERLRRLRVGSGEAEGLGM